MRRFAARHQLPPKFQGALHQRQDACDFCGSAEGTLVAQMDYWDLSEHSVVQCRACQLIQLDPMLTESATQMGCQAYYIHELKTRHPKEFGRHRVRNLRKGIAYAGYLKSLGMTPKKSLEIGAGDAFFSRGLNMVFPNLQVECLDVVPEIRRQIEEQHGFQTIARPIEALNAKDFGPYDVIIGRDIIEHVRSPSLVLKKVFASLNPGGIFHFTTPNGYEDIWFTHTLHRLKNQVGEQLINHVTFFPALTLARKLEEIGFQIRQFEAFDFKGTLREAKCRTLDPNLMSAPSTKRSARAMIESPTKSLSPSQSAHAVIQKLLFHSPRWAVPFYTFRTRPGLYCDATIGVGHELIGSLQKPI